MLLVLILVLVVVLRGSMGAELVGVVHFHEDQDTLTSLRNQAGDDLLGHVLG